MVSHSLISRLSSIILVLVSILVHQIACIQQQHPTGAAIHGIDNNNRLSAITEGFMMTNEQSTRPNMTISLLATSYLGPCDNLDVTANITFLETPSPSLDDFRLEWSLLIYPPNEEAHSFMRNQTGKTQISVPAKFFEPALFYIVYFNTTYLPTGESIVEGHPFTKNDTSNLPGFQIALDDAPPFQVKRSEAYEFYASITNMPWCLLPLANRFIFPDGYLIFPTNNSSRVKLTVPRLMYPAGTRSLQIEFKMPIYSIIRTYATFEFISEPPVAVISGGNRMVLKNQKITLSGSQSSDPEMEAVGNQLFYWSCPKCQLTDTDVKTSQIEFNEITPGTYVIELTYTPDYVNLPKRTAKVTTTIQVVDRDVPIPSITSKVASIINTQDRLRITATLDSELVKKNNIIYQWYISVNGGTSTPVTTATKMLAPLSFDANTLLPNTKYQFSIRARYYEDSIEDLMYGEASVYAETATPPVIHGGSVRSNRLNGTALDTIFSLTVNATDRSDAYPLLYSFFYFSPTEKRFVSLRTFSRFSQLDTILPTGFGVNNELILACTVTNAFGYSSSTTKDLVVQVFEKATTPIESISQIDQLAKELNSLVDQPTKKETILSVVTATIDQTAKSTTSRTDLDKLTKVVDDLIVELVTDISKELNQTVQSAFATSFESKASALEVLTRNSKVLSPTSINQAYYAVDSILDASVSSDQHTLTEDQTKLVALSISNLYSVNTTNPQSTNEALRYVEKLRMVLTSNKAVTESPSIINTQSFTLMVQVDYGENLKQQSWNTTENIAIQLPSSIDTSINGSDTYSVQLLSFTQDSAPYLWSDSAQNISSPVLTFSLIGSNSEKVKLQELKDPIEIVLPKYEYISDDTLYSYQCKYSDETSGDGIWDTKGCWLHKETENEVICRCSHTTSFASFIIYDPDRPNKASVGLYVTSIVVHAIFMITCIGLLITIFLWRDKQPIRSRYLTPYIGLFAIIVECILQGVIRNSLLIASNETSSDKIYNGINAMAYLVMSISSPLILLSLFIFFWQQLRYFSLKNLYAIMDVEKANHIKMRLLRLLSSKIVYVCLGASIYLIACAYFVIISILEGSNVISANASTVFNAISFASVSLGLGVLILVAFLWDSTIVLSRKLLYRKQKPDEDRAERQLTTDTDTNAQQVDNGTKSIEMAIIQNTARSFIDHFTSDDPLYFRIESIFMVLAMLMMIVSYSVGMSDRFNDNASPNSAAKIVEFLFDLVYISLRILSFGGFAVLVRLNHRFKLHAQIERYTDLKRYQSDLRAGVSDVENELLSLLRDGMGGDMFRKYAKKEFSLENIMLFQCLERFRSDNIVMTEEQRSAMMNDIHSKYLAHGSPYEVNVSNKCRKLFVAAAEKQKSKLNASETEEVLLTLFNEVMVNICDTFTRFSSTEEYAQYLKVKDMIIKLETVSSLQV